VQHALVLFHQSDKRGEIKMNIQLEYDAAGKLIVDPELIAELDRRFEDLEGAMDWEELRDKRDKR
jgi:hypothetical protein